MATSNKTPGRDPTTLLEAVRLFSDPDVAFDFFRRYRWPNGNPACPHCGCLDPYFLTTRRIWKCKGCRKQFSIKVGTIFEDSPLGLDKWLPAMWLIANAKNSVSSHELGRSLGVTQKTAWFMLHRIREALAEEAIGQLSGTVEVDETYMGGQAKFMHQAARDRKIHGRGPGHKTAVQGARERSSGTVKAEVTKAGSFKSNVAKWVEPGSNVYTDENTVYRRLDVDLGYTHKYVTHGREYVSGIVHTNGIENFWSLLKRSIKGTQVHVSPEHLNRYVTERAFAYNQRFTDDLGRMRVAAIGADGRRLTWKALTAK
ncbi:MAG: IS1595 family transposase [Acidimicrobiales bacterium]